MPDIILLPEIATYFDVSVDTLIGYEPQLSKEQIQKIYGELGENFATLSFEEVFEKSEILVKKYHSCYLILMQIYACLSKIVCLLRFPICKICLYQNTVTLI